MNTPTFEITKGHDGWYFRLKDAQGECLISGRSYASKSDAVHGIATVMKFGTSDARYRRKNTPYCRCYFVLTTQAGKVMGWSESVNSQKELERIIMECRKAIPMARIIDNVSL